MIYEPLERTFKLVNLRTQEAIRFKNARSKQPGAVDVERWPIAQKKWVKEGRYTREDARKLWRTYRQRGYTPSDV